MLIEVRNPKLYKQWLAHFERKGEIPYIAILKKKTSQSHSLNRAAVMRNLIGVTKQERLNAERRNREDKADYESRIPFFPHRVLIANDRLGGVGKWIVRDRRLIHNANLDFVLSDGAIINCSMVNDPHIEFRFKNLDDAVECKLLFG